MRHSGLALTLALLVPLACTDAEPAADASSETCSDEPAGPEQPEPNPMPGVRRSVSALTPAELREIRDAIIALKHSPPIWDYDSVCDGDDPAVLLAPGSVPYEKNAYDYFVELHTRGAAISAWKMTSLEVDRVPGLPDSHLHMSSTFLPWHREFLLRFELALRIVSGNDELMLPYWDWTDPDEIDIVFSDDFLGGLGDSGSEPSPVSGLCDFSVHLWTPDASEFGSETEIGGLSLDNRSLSERKDITVPAIVTTSCANDSAQLPLERLDLSGSLPTGSEVASTLAVDTYDVSPWNMTVDPNASFRQQLEGFPVLPFNLDCGNLDWQDCWNTPTGVTALHMFTFFFGLTVHAQVHGSVGGHMGAYSAPNDPVFFLHHAMVDRIWAQWQDEHGFSMADYPDDPEHALLFGFNVAAADVWDYRELGYSYE